MILRGLSQLRALERHGGELHACQVNPTRVRKQLEADGLIERVAREGASWPRYFNIRLTERGREVIRNSTSTEAVDE